MTRTSEEPCHMCGNMTEFYCRECDEPVCEDCAVPFTLQNQIDYTLCQVCHEGNEARRAMYYWEKEEEAEREKEKREHRNRLARNRYWRAENIEKRRIARENLKREKAEQARRMLAEAFKTVNDWFA